MANESPAVVLYDASGNPIHVVERVEDDVQILRLGVDSMLDPASTVAIFSSMTIALQCIAHEAKLTNKFLAEMMDECEECCIDELEDESS